VKPYPPETLVTLVSAERAEAVAEERPGATALRETRVVVRLAVVHERADAVALADGVVEVALHRHGIEVLEELRVGPLHAALAEQPLRQVPRSPEALGEEDGVREFLPHRRQDVLPRGQWDHVGSVAAEPVDAATAPLEQRLGDRRPEPRMRVVELDEVLPPHAPRARRVEAPVALAQEPVRVVLEEPRPPARVVHDDVEEDHALACVHRVRELAELVDARGLLVEDDERRIDARHVELRVGAPEAPHACVRRRRRPDRQEVQDAAAEHVDDVRDLGGDVPERPGRRDHRVARLVEPRDLGRVRALEGVLEPLRRTEAPGERAIDRVARADVGGMHREREIVPVRPGLSPLGVDHVRLRTEVAHLEEREVEGEAVLPELERDVAPRGAGEGRLVLGQPTEQGDRLAPGDLATRQVGA